MTIATDLVIGLGSAGSSVLGIGGNGQVLTVSAGVPVWAASASTPVSPFLITGTPPANANQGALELGGGVFGGGAGTFAGAAAGTGIAVNLPSGSTANLLDLQVAGVSKVNITSAGLLTLGSDLAVPTTGWNLRYPDGRVMFLFNGSGEPIWTAIAATRAGAGLFNLSGWSGGFTGGAGTFGGSASGTQLAINANTGFTGNLIDAQLFGVSKFKVDSTGAATLANGLTVSASGARITGDPGGLAGAMGVTNVTGLGNGAQTAVTAPLVGTGSGPATPTAVAQWLKVYDGATTRWIPMMV